MFEKVGCPIEGNNIKNCYWIRNTNKRVMVKFSGRKNRQNITHKRQKRIEKVGHETN